jgi:uncharacterized OB-fold protein
MAFLKKANAAVTHPNWGPQNWVRFVEEHDRELVGRGKTRTASGSPNLVAQASEILKQEFDPKNFLLTHATIVASVDTDEVSNVRLGTVSEFGHNVNRKWANFRVRPQCDIYINNNNDCWSRPVLLKSYRTFVGAFNFCEHVQIEEQSKGRIIDAVARDIGDSVYADILIATDRRHASLVRDIESGRMSTLSMGCFLEGAQVSMADGTRVAIEDVAPGDLVITHRGRAREVLNKQIKPYRGEMRHIQAVGVSSTIRATANHGFEVLRQPTVCACGCGEDLGETSTHTRAMTRRFKHGHIQRIYNSNNTYSLDEARQRKEKIAEIKSFTFEKVRADALAVGDFLCFPRVAFKGNSGGWTVGKARLVGYFLAEGSFLKRKGEPVEVQFNFSMTEKDTYVREVVDLLRQEFPEANAPWLQDRPERTTCVVHAYGRELAAWFHQHCGEYSHRKRMSTEVMGLPAEFHRHVVGAWLNGDGTFGKDNKSLSGTSCSYDLACQMHLLLVRCGVFARMECQQNGQHIEIAEAVGAGWARHVETGKRPAITLVMGMSLSHTLSDVCDKAGRRSEKEQQLRLLDDKVIFPITSIETNWHDGLVYNMEVEEDHTYLVEGVAVHNCSVTETQCTKCGNVAVDETEMCEHVRYAKGNYEFDAQGRKYRIAELCGHESLDPTGGVTFIEASWVAVPAFTGAVMRNILEPEQINAGTRERTRAVLASPPPEWMGDEGRLKAARFDSAVAPPVDVSDDTMMRRLAQFPPMPGAAPGGAPEGAPPAPEEKDPLEELEEKLEKTVLDRVKKRIEKKLRQEDDDAEGSSSELETSTNENINHQAALRRRAALINGADALVRIARSDVELLDGLARLNQSHGVRISRDLYRAVLRVGSTDGQPSLEKYLSLCAGVLGRKPTTGEAKTMVRLGRILSLRKKTRF